MEAKDFFARKLKEHLESTIEYTSTGSSRVPLSPNHNSSLQTIVEEDSESDVHLIAESTSELIIDEPIGRDYCSSVARGGQDGPAIRPLGWMNKMRKRQVKESKHKRARLSSTPHLSTISECKGEGSSSSTSHSESSDSGSDEEDKLKQAAVTFVGGVLKAVSRKS